MLAVIVVNAPDKAEDEPIVVPSMEPPSISTLSELNDFPVSIVTSPLRVTSPVPVSNVPVPGNIVRFLLAAIFTSPLRATSPVPVSNVLEPFIVVLPLRVTSPVPVSNVPVPGNIVRFLLAAIFTSPLRATSPVPVVNVLEPPIVVLPLRATSPVPVVNVPVPDNIVRFLLAAIFTSPLRATSPVPVVIPPFRLAKPLAVIVVNVPDWAFPPPPPPILAPDIEPPFIVRLPLFNVRLPPFIIRLPLISTCPKDASTTNLSTVPVPICKSPLLFTTNCS